MKLEATALRGDRWAVRPEGQLGTCGWHPEPWTVIYVKAVSAVDAVTKAERYEKQRNQHSKNDDPGNFPGYRNGSKMPTDL